MQAQASAAAGTGGWDSKRRTRFGAPRGSPQRTRTARFGAHPRMPRACLYPVCAPPVRAPVHKGERHRSKTQFSVDRRLALRSDRPASRVRGRGPAWPRPPGPRASRVPEGTCARPSMGHARGHRAPPLTDPTRGPPVQRSRGMFASGPIGRGCGAHLWPLAGRTMAGDSVGTRDLWERRPRGAGAGSNPWVPTPFGTYLPRYPGP